MVDPEQLELFEQSRSRILEFSSTVVLTKKVVCIKKKLFQSDVLPYKRISEKNSTPLAVKSMCEALTNMNHHQTISSVSSAIRM